MVFAWKYSWAERYSKCITIFAYGIFWKKVSVWFLMIDSVGKQLWKSPAKNVRVQEDCHSLQDLLWRIRVAFLMDLTIDNVVGWYSK